MYFDFTWNEDSQGLDYADHCWLTNHENLTTWFQDNLYFTNLLYLLNCCEYLTFNQLISHIYITIDYSTFCQKLHLHFWYKYTFSLKWILVSLIIILFYLIVWTYNFSNFIHVICLLHVHLYVSSSPAFVYFQQFLKLSGNVIKSSCQFKLKHVKYTSGTNML